MADAEAVNRRASLFSRIKSVFLTWLDHPTSVASVCPSSRVLTQKIADRSAVRDASLVIDLGPATGETSVALLERMGPDAKLLAIEKMEEFIQPLNEIDDKRLIVQHGDAACLRDLMERHGLGRADVIVSGVPFSTIDKPIGQRIVDGIHDQLKDGGLFIAYQFRDDVVPLATPLFGEPDVDRVHLNVPPLTIYTWTKS
ncbi:hypothetical protein K227x_04210 [Rubripirellula lacrimiformis]|uniref:16S ribosomal RNA methyltransferase KsgA/Dim1 family protein n=1 Tax=Rubripirellula lacrimiformis TaxID=1930273 RepID=A0A517N4H9_9BACT|nr:methyltransferase domain-containing protein [Rubripirellula lacrimiformis]QDT02050.1 hypothetical protein K227x_04210 [Rubripirellula lacrimiformis]